MIYIVCVSAAGLGTPSRSPMERAMAHSDQALGRAGTTHTPRTKIVRLQLLDLHPVPTDC